MQENPTSLPSGQAMATPPSPKSPLGYTAAEVAAILGKHVNTIYAWIDKGILPHRQFGGVGAKYIPRRAVRALLDFDDDTADLVSPTGGEAA
jgi:excisionase family DNA binding protein